MGQIVTVDGSLHEALPNLRPLRSLRETPGLPLRTMGFQTRRGAASFVLFQGDFTRADVERPRAGSGYPEFARTDLGGHPEVTTIAVVFRAPLVGHENHSRLLGADDLEHHRGLRAVGLGLGLSDV